MVGSRVVSVKTKLVSALDLRVRAVLVEELLQPVGGVVHSYLFV